MSLVYRAIWRDDLPNASEIAVAAWTEWVDEKTDGALRPLDAGESAATIMRRGDSVTVETRLATAQGDGPIRDVARADLIETAAAAGNRWHTILRSWTTDDDPAQGWLWVDVEAVGDIEIGALGPRAPKLVRSLLDIGVAPRLDDAAGALSTRPTFYRGAQSCSALAATILDPNRRLPVVVIAEDPARFAVFRKGPYTFGSIVSNAAKALAGVAAVAAVDAAAAGALTTALGERHGVYDGAFRMYLTGLDTSISTDAWRHRYVTADRYYGSAGTAAHIAARTLAPVSAVRQPPASYPAAKALLGRATATDTDTSVLLAYALDELGAAETLIDELRERLRIADEDAFAQEIDLQAALEDRLSALHAADEAKRHVGYLQAQLTTADQFWNADAAATSMPTSASNPSDAARKARDHLGDRLEIPDAALRDLDVLDSTPNAGSWGQMSWLAFRSLHAFVTEVAAGTQNNGYWIWCQSSGHELAWRATPDKLAMKESDTVNKSPKLSAHRDLPVSTEVSESGVINMQAHIKIATGGGMLAPRIYFHIDNERNRVHVGFFGPHKYMPNTKT